MTKKYEDMTIEELKEELDRVNKEKEAVTRAGERSLSLRISQKGALSLYGMGRFPVTLYKSQWLRVLGAADDIRAYIDANGHLMTEKTYVER